MKSTLTSPLSEAKKQTNNYINMKLAFVFTHLSILMIYLIYRNYFQPFFLLMIPLYLRLIRTMQS